MEIGIGGLNRLVSLKKAVNSVSSMGVIQARPGNMIRILSPLTQSMLWMVFYSAVLSSSQFVKFWCFRTEALRSMIGCPSRLSQGMSKPFLPQACVCDVRLGSIYSVTGGSVIQSRQERHCKQVYI